MIIVMYAGGIPFNGETIQHRSLGGSESACYYVARELASRGHEVTVFTECRDEGVFDGVRYCFAGERGQDAPLGANWKFFCENTPHDVNIAQRHPLAYHHHIQSKINLFWAHDLCTHRNSDAFMAGAWQVNRVLTVSEWFKKQMCKTWTVNPDVVTPVHNGVDYSLFEQMDLKDNSKPSDELTMIYCSRPERGLDHLVAEGGVMEQLLEKAPHAHLLICGYEHSVPEMKGFYEHLHRRVTALPNCTHLGALTKNELYKVMCEKADVWVYPTEFEEVSCITAMECMAAGLTIVTSTAGALPETIGDYENAVMFNSAGEELVQKTVDWVTGFDGKFRRVPRRHYPWSRVADEFESIIREEFEQCTKNKDALARHFLRNSDVSALRLLVENHPSEVSREVAQQLSHYVFDRSPQAFAEHYEKGVGEQYDSASWKYEQNFEHHPRFQAVADEVAKLPDESTIIDYGCAHGHFTNYLARMFPQHSFLGIDVSRRAVDLAEAKAREWNLHNIRFETDDWLADVEEVFYDCDLLILGEVLEHVPSPESLLDKAYRVVGECRVVVTTPFGPWEELSYEKDHPWRYHLHHLEKDDLKDLFCAQDDLSITCMPHSRTRDGVVLGWYVTRFNMVERSFGAIDYQRKLKIQSPRQTVSFCGIVRNGEDSLKKLLSSVESVVDEVIIGIDETTTDRTEQIIQDFQSDLRKHHRAPELRVSYFSIASPLKTGFDEARNEVLGRASCDWIMWADADEELVEQGRLSKFFRRNGWNGYGVAQHHFSVEPTIVLNTDYPVRILRRDPKVRFLGVVHEHPEHVDKPNEGVGFAWVNPGIHFAHSGYSTEAVRRGRFRRNIELMARDRKKNPERLLGKFLWIRDLSLMCRFELEQTGGAITQEMVRRAQIGLTLWEETLQNHGSHPQVRRMVTDHLQFYDTLVNVMNTGFIFRVKIASGLNGSAPQLSQVPELSARFLNKKHLDLFLSVIVDREVEYYEDKYL